MKRPARKLVKILLSEDEAMAFLIPYLSKQSEMAYKVEKMIRVKIGKIFPEIAILEAEYNKAREIQRELWKTDPEFRTLRNSFSDKRQPLYQQQDAIDQEESAAKSAYLNDKLAKLGIHNIIDQKGILRRKQ